MKLEGRVAIVSGGSRGIGQAIALALAEAGADVAINYRRNDAAAEATVSHIEALGRRARAFKANVADYEEVKEMVVGVIDALGKVDILVSNAGIASRGRFLADTDVEEMHRVINTHLFGAFHLTKEALPYMRREKRGDIIFISSRATLNLSPGHIPYAVAKSGLEAMAKCLAKEEMPNGIRVNIIGPGLVETEMGRRLAIATRGVEDIKDLYATSAFGRVAQPADVGNLVAFLCSEEGGYISGQAIYLAASDEL